MAGIVCTDLWGDPVEGDPTRFKFRWKLNQQHIDHFEFEWHFTATNLGSIWTIGGTATVKPSLVSGWYTYVMNTPDPATCKKLRFKVKPVATKKTEYYYEGKTKKSRQADWWSGSWVTSLHVFNPLDIQNYQRYRELEAQLEDKLVPAARAAKADADKARTAGEWKKAISADQLAQKRASEAIEVADKALALLEVQDWDYSYWKPRIEAWKSEMESQLARYKELERQDEANLSEADKRAKMNGQVANAKTCLANAKKFVEEAAVYRKQGKLGNSAASEDKASTEFESAAYWYNLAAGNASSDAQRKIYQDAQASARSSASAADARASADRSQMSETAARPEPPSAEVTQHEDASGAALLAILIDVNCAAKWSDRIIIYRDVDFKGEWPVWKTIMRTVPKSGGPWSVQRVYDTTVQAGHSYRYFFRSGVGSSNVSDRTAVHGPFNQRPSQPRNLAAKLAGDGMVSLTWENTGHASADSVEVQYSSFYSTTNAWIANAAQEIQTIVLPGGAQTATVTGLEAGKTWYFRVKRVSEGGSAWATVVGGEANNYLTVSCKVPSTPMAKLAKPTSLKAEKASDTSVKLSWSDTLEEGARYEIEHSVNGSAWANNAVRDIETEQYANPGGQYTSKSFAYTVTGLEQGRKHFFRVVKRSDGQQAIAEPAVHESKASDWTVFCVLPAPSAALSRPASVKASKATDTSIRLSWSDQQQPGESYEIWYTDSSTAFGDNAMGDIQQASYAEESAASAKVYTLTSLERGRTWFAKVRKVSHEGAGPWSAEVSCRLPAETLGKPTGLKASQASGTSVTLTWTDALEDGAAYTVQHTANEQAFALNALGDIDETGVSNAQSSTAAQTYTYTATGLDKGKKHLFRVRKSKDAASVFAAAAAGATKLDASTCYLALPEDVLPSLSVPTGLAAEPRGDDAVRLAWQAERGEGDTYEVQHTSDAEAFGLGDMGAITSTAVASENASSHSHTISSLGRGATYWFRVRTANDGQVGGWSSVAECGVAAELEPTEELYAPTVADTLLGYSLDGGLVPLSWVHNSSQRSDQSAYELEVTVTKATGQVVPRLVSGQTATAYGMEPASWGLDDGAEVSWRVRTCGAIAGAWSPWSRLQSFRVFAPPVAGIALVGGDGVAVGPGDALTAMPLRITVSATSSNGDPLDAGNQPISYSLRIIAVDGYDGIGHDAQPRYVCAGEEMFSASIDANDEGFDPDGWVLEVASHELALQGGEHYEAIAEVLTSQGLRGVAGSGVFEPQWSASMPQPTASLVFDADSYTCRITPVVNLPEDEWDQDDSDDGDGDGIDTSLTPEERAAMADWGVDTLLPEPTLDLDFELVEDPSVDAAGVPLRPGTTIDVYRLDSDGTPVEVATGLANDGQSRAMDPHPTFGTCTYRIVARDVATGLQSSCDYDVETRVSAVVIQWDEQWNESDDSGQPLYSGSMLELEYNTELGESYARDSVLRDYAGRRHPVAYYGTQRGQGASMTAELIRGMDSRQLALARRLAAWPGDCYVREPNGTGYWANVRVSISHSHSSAAVPVQLDIRRVDHGD